MKIAIIKEEVQTCTGHNCNFEYGTSKEDVVYIEQQGKVYKVYQDEGECGSGWTTASYGNIEEAEWNGGWQYIVPDVNVSVVKDIDYYNNVLKRVKIDGNIFLEVDEYGGDEYYPCGYVKIKKSVLEKYSTGRNTKDIVYLVNGKSNLGKSSLMHRTGLKVFETETLGYGEHGITNEINDNDIIIYNTNFNKITFNESKIDKKIINVTFEELEEE